MLIVVAMCFALVGCAGPHGEKPALDNAVQRPSSSTYGFSGGYAGATGAFNSLSGQ
jgi:hypothetical protein